MPLICRGSQPDGPFTPKEIPWPRMSSNLIAAFSLHSSSWNQNSREMPSPPVNDSSSSSSAPRLELM
jgi:hypothetical protein